jgi:hypothetical protein
MTRLTFRVKGREAKKTRSAPSRRQIAVDSEARWAVVGGKSSGRHLAEVTLATGKNSLGTPRSRHALIDQSRRTL